MWVVQYTDRLMFKWIREEERSRTDLTVTYTLASIPLHFPGPYYSVSSSNSVINHIDAAHGNTETERQQSSEDV